MMSRHRDASLAELVCAARSARLPEHEAAFSEIVRRFRANAQASAFYLLRDAHLAQDVAQEAFLDAYLGLAQLRDPAAFPGWFRRIVFKHADRIRRRSRRSFEELGSAEGEAYGGESPEARAAAREDDARVRGALADLPEHERAVIVLFYFAHRSHAEIAERLLLPPSTVKKRLHDARRRLRIPLDTPEGPPTGGEGRGVVKFPVVLPDTGPTPPAPAPVLHGEDALRLAEIATPETRGVLSRFAPEQVAAALQELPAADQVAFLEVSDRLPEIVPCLPEVTLIQTMRSVGLPDAGWLVEFASPEQRIAALDLDCWRDHRLSPTRVFEWIDALIEAGTETLLAAFDELDPELWILTLQWMAEFSLPGDGAGAREEGPFDDGDCIAADGSSEDGIVFYCAYSPDHEERLHSILSTARIYAPSLYWDFVYGAITEPSHSCEEAATRWHKARLNDLGFPDLEHAMKVYQPLRAESVAVVESLNAPPAEETPVPAMLSGSWLGRALSELPPERASEVQNQLFALTNAIAVADRLSLTSAEALEQSLRKALAGVDRGLAALANAQYRSLGEISDTTATRDLFRIGVTLNPDLHTRPTLGELEEWEELEQEEGFDWDVPDEWLSEADQTLGPDGTLRR